MPLPKTIKIGEVEYDTNDPAFKELISEVRKEEKNKLYSNIAGLETQIRVLTDKEKAGTELTAKQEADLKALRDELAVAKDEKEKLEKEGKKGGDDDKKKDEKKDENGLTSEGVAKLLADALEKNSEKYEAKLEELSKKLTGKTVGDYRKEQIAKYKSELIEDLVPENLTTEAEVNEAIKKAIEKSKPYIRKEYEVDGEKKQLTIAEWEAAEAERKANGGAGGDDDDAGGKGNDGKKAPGKADRGDGDVSGKELLSKIDSMSQEEYEKHADAILKEAKGVKYVGE